MLAMVLRVSPALQEMIFSPMTPASIRPLTVMVTVKLSVKEELYWAVTLYTTSISPYVLLVSVPLMLEAPLPLVTPLM